MTDLNSKVAVHFNFKAKKLSVRAINAATGKLTDQLDLCDEIWLKDAEFT